MTPAMAKRAMTPMTIPAIAPPEMPELLEFEEAATALLEVDCAAAEPVLELDEDLIVVEDLAVDEDDVETATPSCSVVKGDGFAVCVVAVTVLWPIAAKYTELALLTETPAFGDEKLLMQMSI